ncbi:MAG: glycine C-acetyltransferase [Verrucomicrobiales bacterium]|nr:glycine C-acetyltransferase [Verrucomicrobiales bacterium]
MHPAFLDHLRLRLDQIETAGTHKTERLIGSPQNVWITLSDGRRVLNLCANNYLGMAQHPAVKEAAHRALDTWGYGLASVRFICGTQSLHRQLEERLSAFLGTEDTILYTSCFDANGGLFETLLDEEDAVISDELNHASIIDGVRLCKARRLRYRNNDMADLEDRLKEASDARFRLIATDGVFSMDGTIADLRRICDLAERYDALVMVDDSHATGFLGTRGRGTPEHCGVEGRVDILTGTLGKALGGASGGYTSGRQEIVNLLRQRSRPYLFSNTLCPGIAGGTLAVLDLIESDPAPRERLRENARFFRGALESEGFTIPSGSHPIIPIMLGDAALAGKYSAAALEHGLYVVGFSFPVVAQGKARLRTQMTAAHTQEDLDHAVAALTAARREIG